MWGKKYCHLLKQNWQKKISNQILRKRVFSILVEILENVAKYSPGREAEEQFGMPVAMIRLADRDYSLTTGNLILNSEC